MPSYAAWGDVETYLKQIQKTPLLSAQEERALGQRIRENGCAEARDRMIRSNLRLVICIAKRYANMGLPINDLIEEGNIGLVRAVETFDPDNGARFSTYASWWIKQCIRRALRESHHPIRIPGYMQELVRRLKRAKAQLRQSLGRDPTTAELAGKMQVPPKRLRAVTATLQVLRRVMPIAREVHGQMVDMADTLPDQRYNSPDYEMAWQDQLRKVRRLLDQIDHREATILRLRYGLDGSQPMTLRQIGQVIGVTRERVRQIEAEVLRKLQLQLSV